MLTDRATIKKINKKMGSKRPKSRVQIFIYFYVCYSQLNGCAKLAEFFQGIFFAKFDALSLYMTNTQSFNGTVVNRTFPSLHGGSLKIVLTVPLSLKLNFVKCEHPSPHMKVNRTNHVSTITQTELSPRASCQLPQCLQS